MVYSEADDSSLNFLIIIFKRYFKMLPVEAVMGA